jgi:hypothetical protein
MAGQGSRVAPFAGQANLREMSFSANHYKHVSVRVPELLHRPAVHAASAAFSPELQAVLQQVEGWELCSHDMQLDYHHFTADAVLRVRPGSAMRQCNSSNIAPDSHCLQQ